jgi:hypothetical protein
MDRQRQEGDILSRRKEMDSWKEHPHLVDRVREIWGQGGEKAKQNIGKYAVLFRNTKMLRDIEEANSLAKARAEHESTLPNFSQIVSASYEYTKAIEDTDSERIKSAKAELQEAGFDWSEIERQRNRNGYGDHPGEVAGELTYLWGLSGDEFTLLQQALGYMYELLKNKDEAELKL